VIAGSTTTADLKVIGASDHLLWVRRVLCLALLNPVWVAVSQVSPVMESQLARQSERAEHSLP
jgi:hypothetical protein